MQNSLTCFWVLCSLLDCRRHPRSLLKWLLSPHYLEMNLTHWWNCCYSHQHTTLHLSVEKSSWTLIFLLVQSIQGSKKVVLLSCVEKLQKHYSMMCIRTHKLAYTDTPRTSCFQLQFIKCVNQTQTHKNDLKNHFLGLKTLIANHVVVNVVE